jgi:hypothetical protein
MFAAGAGKMGSYDSCCWQVKGTSQYRFVEEGAEDVEQDEEWKVEMLCADDCITNAIDALKANHPYEEPIYQYWEVKA